MAHSNLQRWEREFRKAAGADEYDLLGDHHCKLELPERPELLLEGTINVIYACAAYAALDNQSFALYTAYPAQPQKQTIDVLRNRTGQI